MNELGILDVEDLARIYKTTPGAIRKRISRGALPRPFKDGRKNYWTKEQLIERVEQLADKHAKPELHKKRGRPKKELSVRSRKTDYGDRS